MESLLIDVGALAIFLGYVAIVYWHAVSQPRGRRLIDTSRAADARNRGSHGFIVLWRLLEALGRWPTPRAHTVLTHKRATGLARVKHVLERHARKRDLP